MIKRYLYILAAIILETSLLGCGTGAPLPESPITIIYDNDPHCTIDGYSRVAGLKAGWQSRTPYVTVVSCGDFVQGNAIGAITGGEAVVEIMNNTGYSFATLGNHEFDFGMDQQTALAQMLDAEILCANFTDLQSGTPVYKPYEIVKYGNVEVAFIGIATPQTATAASPKTFMDTLGNPRYSFHLNNLFETVQNYIDEARNNGADYVVALSHLGDEKEGEYPTSIELIGGTTGLDALLDGHSHNAIPDTLVPNKKGKGVHMSSSGSYFQNIGILTLSTEGKFSAQLMKTSDVEPDSSMQNYIENVRILAMEAGERIIGYSRASMPALDKDGEWLVRDREMPIGNFCADAFRIMLDTDIAMINGGGIRADIPEGEIAYNTLLSVFPFNNTACTATITGQQLLDALEVAVMALPEKSGSFMHVSGMRMQIDCSIASPVVKDSEGLFSHIGNGKRRVAKVLVLNKKSGQYIPVEKSRTYTLGSINYNITGLGSEGIFRYTALVQDNMGQDVEILANYLNSLGGTIGNGYSRTDGRIMLEQIKESIENQ